MPQKITEEMGVHKEWMAEAKNQTMETLPEFLRKLTGDYEHDYGTICHAIAAAAVGAAWAVEKTPQGGITGFQAGAIMWEMIRGWGVFGDGPKRMLSYGDMLFPQYRHKFTNISPETAKWLQEEAKKKLSEKSHPAHPDVVKHWEFVAGGGIPFGYRISDEG